MAMNYKNLIRLSVKQIELIIHVSRRFQRHILKNPYKIKREFSKTTNFDESIQFMKSIGKFQPGGSIVDAFYTM